MIDQPFPAPMIEPETLFVSSLELDFTNAYPNPNENIANIHHTTSFADKQSWIDRGKNFIIFVLSTSLSTFVYWASEKMVLTVQGTDINPTMFDAPTFRTIFYLACLASIADLIIRANGTIGSGFHIRNYQYSNIGIAIVFALTVFTMFLVPSIYENAPAPKENLFSRGNCSAPLDIHQDFYTKCPTFNTQPQSFIDTVPTASLSQSTSLDRIKIYYRFVERIIAREQYIPVLAEAIHKNDQTLKYLYLFQDMDCVYKLLDAICEYTFVRCNHNNCSMPQQHVDIGQNVTLSCIFINSVNEWLTCGINKCKEAEGCIPSLHYSNGQVKKIINELITQFNQVIKELFDPQSAEFLNIFFNKFKILFERTQPGQGFDRINRMCPKDDVTHMDETDQVNHVNVDNNALEKISCNPQNTTYFTDATTASYDSRFLLLITYLLFNFKVGYFAVTNNKLYFHLSIARTSCLCIALLMSMLVYIGALSLEKAAILNQNDQTQTFWSAIYFIVSWLCFYGGLGVLVREPKLDLKSKSSYTENNDNIDNIDNNDNNDNNNNHNDNQTKQQQKETHIDILAPDVHDTFDSGCCPCPCQCCNQCLTTLGHCASFFKENFMDADGYLL